MNHKWNYSLDVCNNCGGSTEDVVLGYIRSECPGELPELVKKSRNKIHHNEVIWPLIFRLTKTTKGPELSQER